MRRSLTAQPSQSPAHSTDGRRMRWSVGRITDWLCGPNTARAAAGTHTSKEDWISPHACTLAHPNTLSATVPYITTIPAAQTTATPPRSDISFRYDMSLVCPFKDNDHVQSKYSLHYRDPPHTHTLRTYSSPGSKAIYRVAHTHRLRRVNASLGNSLITS